MPKLGYISGSRFKPMMTKGRKKDEVFGSVAKALATRIVFERRGWVDLEENYITKAMQWGIDHEAEAIERFQDVSYLDVHSSQEWQQHKDHAYVGVTPDGLVGEEGLLEVKCPNTDNHILNVFDGHQKDLYKYQIQGSLWVTGRNVCYFVSYDPRCMKDIVIHEIPRDEKLIGEMNDRIVEFEGLISEYQQIVEDA